MGMTSTRITVCQMITSSVMGLSLSDDPIENSFSGISCFFGYFRRPTLLLQLTLTALMVLVASGNES